MYKMEISIQEKKKFMCSWTTNGVQLKRSQAQQKNTARTADVVIYTAKFEQLQLNLTKIKAVDNRLLKSFL